VRKAFACPGWAEPVSSLCPCVISDDEGTEEHQCPTILTRSGQLA
jgi:hypothetical protein